MKRRLIVGFIVTIFVAITVAACSGGGSSKKSHSYTLGMSDNAITALAINAAHRMHENSPTLIHWDATTRGAVAKAVQNGNPNDTTPVIYITVRGHFRDDFAFLPSPNSPHPTGQWAEITVDPNTGDVTDFTLSPSLIPITTNHPSTTLPGGTTFPTGVATTTPGQTVVTVTVPVGGE